MKVLPAIDLRGGACVQLVGGDYQQERVRWPDPLRAAAHWRALGFTELHVVDLDAATGRGEHTAVVTALAQSGPVQVGGGLRDEAAIARVLAAGALRAVVGTRAVQDPDWLAAMAKRFPQRLVLAADVRERTVVGHGWSRELGSLAALLQRAAPLPLGGVLVTAVHREGQEAGTDLPLFGDVLAMANAPVFASGGIHSRDELHALAAMGCAGAVLGMSLYTGRLDASVLAQEFSS